jgi:AhpD family alkylhydroperoxidase
MAAVAAPGALGMKQKKLISLALSVMGKCERCVMINARAAREAGASDQEISEAAALGIAFGGAPVAMFYNTLRMK